jgi:hypothetical protein
MEKTRTKHQPPRQTVSPFRRIVSVGLGLLLRHRHHGCHLTSNVALLPILVDVMKAILFPMMIRAIDATRIIMVIHVINVILFPMLNNAMYVVAP